MGGPPSEQNKNKYYYYKANYNILSLYLDYARQGTHMKTLTPQTLQCYSHTEMLKIFPISGYLTHWVYVSPRNKTETHSFHLPPKLVRIFEELSFLSFIKSIEV